MPQKTPLSSFTLPFSKFWSWVQLHPNCILRAGTPDAVLFDDDDLHWHFSVEGDGTYLVQLIRGKKLMGELALVPADITYVQVEPGEGEEFRFECVIEAEGGAEGSSYHFVLSHGWEEETEEGNKRYTH
jgi:hypothetical protein